MISAFALAVVARPVLRVRSKRGDVSPLLLGEPTVLGESLLSQHVGVGVYRVEERVVVAAQLPLEDPFRQRLRVWFRPLARFVVESLQILDDAADRTFHIVV